MGLQLRGKKVLVTGASSGIGLATARAIAKKGAVLAISGRRVEAQLSVSGCEVDTSEKLPWGHPLTPPGQQRCTLVVTWSASAGVTVVDPAWTTTMSMAHARAGHTATGIPGGDPRQRQIAPKHLIGKRVSLCPVLTDTGYVNVKEITKCDGAPHAAVKAAPVATPPPPNDYTFSDDEIPF